LEALSVGAEPGAFGGGGVRPRAVQAEEVEATWAVQPPGVEAAIKRPHGDGFRMAGTDERGLAWVVFGDGPGRWGGGGAGEEAIYQDQH
jgi:hypothetical protein